MIKNIIILILVFLTTLLEIGILPAITDFDFRFNLFLVLAIGIVLFFRVFGVYFWMFVLGILFNSLGVLSFEGTIILFILIPFLIEIIFKNNKEFSIFHYMVLTSIFIFLVETIIFVISTLNYDSNLGFWSLIWENINQYLWSVLKAMIFNVLIAVPIYCFMLTKIREKLKKILGENDKGRLWFAKN